MILDGSFFIAVKSGTHCQICFGSPVGTSPRLERKFNFHRLDESSWALYLPHFAPGQGDAGSGPWPTLDDLATPCLMGWIDAYSGTNCQELVSQFILVFAHDGY